MIPFYKLCVCTKSGNIGQHLEAYLVVTNMKAGGAAKHLTTHRTFPQQRITPFKRQ